MAFCMFAIFCLGDSGEGFRLTDCGHRQAKVSGSIRHHRGSVHVDHQKTHSTALREGHLPLRRQNGAPV